MWQPTSNPYEGRYFCLNAGSMKNNNHDNAVKEGRREGSLFAACEASWERGTKPRPELSLIGLNRLTPLAEFDLDQILSGAHISPA